MHKFLCLALIALPVSAWADIINIDASERGFVCTGSGCSSANNGAGPNQNYFAGDDDFGAIAQLRNWFEFAIPTFSGASLTSATLSLYDLSHSGGDLTFAVYGLSGRPLAFTDVTTSNPFGSVATSTASTGTTITITLNAAALAAINADQGGNLFIGGIDSGENAASLEGDFGSTGPGSSTTLNLTTTPTAVPEPSSAALALTAFLAATFISRRAKARTH